MERRGDGDFGVWGLGGFRLGLFYPGCRVVKVGFRVKDLHYDNVPCRLQLFTSGAPTQNEPGTPCSALLFGESIPDSMYFRGST